MTGIDPATKPPFGSYLWSKQVEEGHMGGVGESAPAQPAPAKAEKPAKKARKKQARSGSGVLCCTLDRKLFASAHNRWPPCESYVPKLPRRAVSLRSEHCAVQAPGYNEDGLHLEEIVNPVRLLYSSWLR
jgi:hypothetical protein